MRLKWFFIGLALLFVVLTVLACTSTNKYDFEETTHEVQSGECLWTIASQYRPKGMDMWEYIEQIREVNCLESYTVYPGQTLTVYVKQET
jgi:hypothetical protein